MTVYLPGSMSVGSWASTATCRARAATSQGVIAPTEPAEAWAQPVPLSPSAVAVMELGERRDRSPQLLLGVHEVHLETRIALPMVVVDAARLDAADEAAVVVVDVPEMTTDRARGDPLGHGVDGSSR